MRCLTFVVSGIVQGVGFRAFVKKEAQGLGLAGWVRNCSDGTVDVLACGPEEGLRLLEAVLAKGPRSARVVKVEKRVVSEMLAPVDFRVRPDADANP